MKDLILTLAVAIIGSGALSALIAGLFTRKAEKKRRNGGLISGVRMILYERIKYLGRHYIERGFIEADELEDLIEMHNTYHDELEGNGFLDKLMADVKKLPIRRKEGSA